MNKRTNEWMNDKPCLAVTFLQRSFKATFHGYNCLPLGPDVVGMLEYSVLRWIQFWNVAKTFILPISGLL